MIAEEEIHDVLLRVIAKRVNFDRISQEDIKTLVGDYHVLKDCKSVSVFVLANVVCVS